MCNDIMPQNPSKRLLDLCNKASTANRERWCTAMHNVCTRIKTEHNWAIYRSLAKSKGWPTEFVWANYRERIISLKPSLDDITREPQAFIDTAAWVYFMQVVQDTGSSLDKFAAGVNLRRRYAITPVIMLTRVG
jgi:hypothetical protein